MPIGVVQELGVFLSREHPLIVEQPIRTPGFTNLLLLVVLLLHPVSSSGLLSEPGSASDIRMEATLDQQREARRQKVLARSQAGHRAPVVDLATEQNEIAPQGVTADLDDDVGGAVVDDHPLPAAAAEDAGKSASRLAAERRRQRILSRSTERMAKVQGDRVIRSGDAAEGEESLDDVSPGRRKMCAAVFEKCGMYLSQQWK